MTTDHYQSALVAIANTARSLVREAERQSEYHVEGGRVILGAHLVQALAGALAALDGVGEVPVEVPARQPWDLYECCHPGCTRHVTEPHAVLCYPCRAGNCQCERATAPNPWWPRHGPSVTAARPQGHGLPRLKHMEDVGLEHASTEPPPVPSGARLRSGPFVVGE